LIFSTMYLTIFVFPVSVVITLVRLLIFLTKKTIA